MFFICLLVTLYIITIFRWVGAEQLYLIYWIFIWNKNKVVFRKEGVVAGKQNGCDYIKSTKCTFLNLAQIPFFLYADLKNDLNCDSKIMIWIESWVLWFVTPLVEAESKTCNLYITMYTTTYIEVQLFFNIWVPKKKNRSLDTICL